MYCLGLNSDIEMTVKGCSKCAEAQNQQRAEPFKPTSTPEMPYSMADCAIFDFQSKTYVLLVEYYSKCIHVEELYSETTDSVISALESVFACHGIP